MTKSELIAQLAARYPQMVLKDIEEAVKAMLDAMARALSLGHRIEIRGFGSFSRSRRPARVGRNPKSGESVLVPEKFVPHFKAGKELRERVDRDKLALSAGQDAAANDATATSASQAPQVPQAQRSLS